VRAKRRRGCMKRRGAWLLALVFVSVLISVHVQEAFAVSLLDGTLTIKGFIRNDSAWRTRNGATNGPHRGLEGGDCILSRNTFQAEILYQPIDWFSLFVMPRIVYDASLDFDQSLEDRIVSSKHHDHNYEKKIREIYADITLPNTRIRIGKQQIMWGESDLFRMADIINPLDISWDYLLYSSVSSFEDIRIPLWAIDVNYSQATGHQLGAELVFMPLNFQEGFEPHRLPLPGSNWDLGLPQFMYDAVRDSEPHNDSSNASYGIKLKGIFGGWDVAIFDFYSRVQYPVFREDFLMRFIGHFSPRGVPHSGKYFQFPFTNKAGATFNKYDDRTKFIWRGECVFQFDEPIVDQSFYAGTFVNTEVYKKNTFSCMLGFDRPTMINFLNPGRSFLISGQFFQKHIFGFHTNYMYDPSPGGTVTDRDQYVFTALVSTGYRWDTINPQLLMAYNLAGEGMFNPQCEFWLGNNWRVGIGYHMLMSRSVNNPYFGLMRDNDQVYTWLKWQFD
jgi:hypothetical protein